jgi:uncharacterized protein
MTVKLKRTTKPTKKKLPDWRVVCRQIAQKQATAEARIAWRVKADKAIIFNHRWEHVQSVVSLALRLAAQTGADPEIVEAAAWLHDIRKGTASHGVAGAKEAKKILDQTNFPPEKVGAVVDAIARHVGLYRAAEAPPLEPIETAVLWDADKLSKLGAQALAYNLSMNYMRGLDLAQRRRNMLEFTQAVLSRTVTSMNSEPARRAAEKRYQAMLAVLTAWEQEEEPSEGWL